MQILIIPGSLRCDNMGDIAMLQATLNRMAGIWPAAKLWVLTDDRDKLKIHCPQAMSVSWKGCKRWLSGQPNTFDCLKARQIFRWNHWRSCLRLIWPPNFYAVREFIEVFFNADVVVLSGCGVITDDFSLHAARVLDLLSLANERGIPTAMLGQGIGPIQNASLFTRAETILPKIRTIFVREGLASPGILKKVGVPDEKIFVTGDDALELAYRERIPMAGNRIGINLRIAGYTGLDNDILKVMQTVLGEKVRQYQTELVALPVLQSGVFSDIATLRNFLNDPGAGLDTPVKLIHCISNCRLVVTSSYHAAVFALAQGIPVVGVVETAYYSEKFKGLVEQFEIGCRVLRADDMNFLKQCAEAIDELWAAADYLKPDLLKSVEHQIEIARRAYLQLPSLLGFEGDFEVVSEESNTPLKVFA